MTQETESRSRQAPAAEAALFERIVLKATRQKKILFVFLSFFLSFFLNGGDHGGSARFVSGIGQELML